MYYSKHKKPMTIKNSFTKGMLLAALALILIVTGYFAAGYFFGAF